jgi:hypothetical protein
MKSIKQFFQFDESARKRDYTQEVDEDGFVRNSKDINKQKIVSIAAFASFLVGILLYMTIYA